MGLTIGTTKTASELRHRGSQREEKRGTKYALLGKAEILAVGLRE